MTYQVLKCPSETQWYIIIISALIVLGAIGLNYVIEDSDKKRAEYKILLEDMGCDALEFQTVNHEWESYRSLALKEHGSKC